MLWYCCIQYHNLRLPKLAQQFSSYWEWSKLNNCLFNIPLFVSLTETAACRENVAWKRCKIYCIICSATEAECYRFCTRNTGTLSPNLKFSESMRSFSSKSANAIEWERIGSFGMLSKCYWWPFFIALKPRWLVLNAISYWPSATIKFYKNVFGAILLGCFGTGATNNSAFLIFWSFGALNS